ncbi:hypothetical protein Tco_1042577 [Tanacetum coccineum]|uniref:Uncharacterized protein n=1 Tax=Tanacetum coccineum TaxID=301880 RepID=A0ABQ5GLL2_9ASTR
MIEEMVIKTKKGQKCIKRKEPSTSKKKTMNKAEKEEENYSNSEDEDELNKVKGGHKKPSKQVKYPTCNTRSSPKPLFDAMSGLSEERKRFRYGTPITGRGQFKATRQKVNGYNCGIQNGKYKVARFRQNRPEQMILHSPTDCTTTLTDLRTTLENAFNSELKARMQNYTRYDASIHFTMPELILHQQRTPQLLKQKKLMQTQEDHLHPIPTLNVDSLKADFVVIQNTCSEKEDSNSETASSKLVKECSLNSEQKM